MGSMLCGLFFVSSAVANSWPLRQWSLTRTHIFPSPNVQRGAHTLSSASKPPRRTNSARVLLWPLAPPRLASAQSLPCWTISMCKAMLRDPCSDCSLGHLSTGQCLSYVCKQCSPGLDYWAKRSTDTVST